MFISQLKDKLASYDRYKEHRINGLKAVFVLELMILFYFFPPLTIRTSIIFMLQSHVLLWRRREQP